MILHLQDTSKIGFFYYEDIYLPVDTTKPCYLIKGACYYYFRDLEYAKSYAVKLGISTEVKVIP